MGREVARRTVAGARWILLLNLASMPLSFLTNTILARVSPLALGHYGAVILFSSAFQTLFVLGGPRVFTRLVPALPRHKRLAFLWSYAVLALGVVLGAGALAALAAPEPFRRILARFGEPPLAVALAFGIEVLLAIFLGHFLWAVLEGPGAAIVTRLPVVGYFAAAVLGLGPLRARLESDPSGVLWNASVVIFGVTVLASAAFVAATREARASEGIHWHLPRGFWSAAAYTQLESAVVFTYLNIAPTFVLLWLDVAALAPLYAAMRYTSLADGVSAQLTALLAPSLATLDASGLRQEAERQARAALSAAMIFLLPAALAVILFAPDLMGVFGAPFRAHAGLLRVVGIAVVLGPVVHFGGGILVAFGAYRTYLAASVVYVGGSVAALVVLVPALGVQGAAWCAVVTAFLNAAAVVAALRLHAGFRVPGRVPLALALAVAAAIAAIALEPGRLGAALLFVGLTAVFAATARVRRSEIADLARRLSGRDQKRAIY